MPVKPTSMLCSTGSKVRVRVRAWRASLAEVVIG